MSRRIIIHEEASFDVIDIAYRIAEDSIEASDRFTDAVNAAFERLAEMPGVGAPREYGSPKLKGMRMYPISGFVKYLIFYQANETELEVVRVLHGARDIESIFLPNASEDET